MLGIGIRILIFGLIVTDHTMEFEWWSRQVKLLKIPKCWTLATRAQLSKIA